MSDVHYVEQHIISTVKEQTDEFIFSTILDYCGTQELLAERHLSKRVIVRALQCFMTEHEEEYKELTKND